MIRYTRAQAHHLDGFLALQAVNLLADMPQEQQAGGFVTTPFTHEQLLHLIAQEHLFVALEGDASKDEQVVGYIVCASWQYLSRYPIFAHMVTLFPEVTQFGEAITLENSYQYGPVCIAAHLRGQGVLPAFFAYAKAQMQPHYSYALTFVNHRNTASARAHMAKLALNHLQDFTFGDQSYYMLGFETKPQLSAETSA